MKVLAMLFALTLAGNIQHSDSQVSKKVQLIQSLYDLHLYEVGQLMSQLFIIPTFPQTTETEGVYSEAVSKQYWSCMSSVPQRPDGCVDHTEMRKCDIPITEIWQKRLPQNAQWIPELMSKARMTLKEHVCNSENGEALVSEMKEVNECRTRLGTIDNTELEKLMGKEQNKPFQQRYQEKLELFKATPTQANLCNLTESIVDMKLAEKLCNRDEPFKALTNYYAASFKTLCV